jgi:hypothetical protein
VNVVLTPLLIIGVIVFIASWFAPVLHILRPGDDRIVGWEAFLFALMSAPFGESWPWRKIVYVLSAATNVVMVGALIAYQSARASHRALRAMLLASAFVNLHWFVLNEDRAALRFGYYLWVASFIIVAYGLGRRGDCS